MKIFKQIAIKILLITLWSSVQAQELLPLKVGVEAFSPPFVVVGANNYVYGFDADMMQIICTTIRRRCVYKSMPFSDLIAAAESGETDVSLSAIAITIERAKRVNFSIPYLIIHHQFLTRTAIAKPPFNYSALDNKRIGYVEGSILGERVQEMPIKNPRLKAYKRLEDEILALNEDRVDFVILDAATALYWEINSSGNLSTFGGQLDSSVPLGIAVHPRDILLLTHINDAIKKYLADGGFHANYKKYLAPFIHPKSKFSAQYVPQ